MRLHSHAYRQNLSHSWLLEIFGTCLVRAMHMFLYKNLDFHDSSNDPFMGVLYTCRALMPMGGLTTDMPKFLAQNHGVSHGSSGFTGPTGAHPTCASRGSHGILTVSSCEHTKKIWKTDQKCSSFSAGNHGISWDFHIYVSLF